MLDLFCLTGQPYAQHKPITNLDQNIDQKLDNTTAFTLRYYKRTPFFTYYMCSCSLTKRAIKRNHKLLYLYLRIYQRIPYVWKY